LVDHTRYFRHAPACLRIAANMCGFAFGSAAVRLLRPLWFGYGDPLSGLGVPGDDLH
jgi:hypothetical protein